MCLQGYSCWFGLGRLTWVAEAEGVRWWCKGCQLWGDFGLPLLMMALPSYVDKTLPMESMSGIPELAWFLALDGASWPSWWLPRHSSSSPSASSCVGAPLWTISPQFSSFFSVWKGGKSNAGWMIFRQHSYAVGFRACSSVSHVNGTCSNGHWSIKLTPISSCFHTCVVMCIPRDVWLCGRREVCSKGNWYTTLALSHRHTLDSVWYCDTHGFWTCWRRQ